MKLRFYLIMLVFLAFVPQMLVSSEQPVVEKNNTACTQDILQAVVHSCGLALGDIIRDIPDENMKKDLIRRFVSSVRFFPDNSGYIYVYTLEGVVVGHGGMKSLEGTNLIDHQDTKGTYDVRLAIKTAIAGGGFFEHYWEKPGKEGEFKKITYVEPVPGTNYFIGAGAYLD